MSPAGEHWVSRYSVSTRVDGQPFSPVQAADGGFSFEGNSDGNTIVSRALMTPIEARYVRIYVEAFAGKAWFQWGVFGCDVPTA